MRSANNDARPELARDRELERLDELIQHTVTQRDLCWFAISSPTRRHRIRRADPIEVAQLELLNGHPMHIPEGYTVHVVVRDLGDTTRRALAAVPRGLPTDSAVPEDVAKEIFEWALREGEGQ